MSIERITVVSRRLAWKASRFAVTVLMIIGIAVLFKSVTRMRDVIGGSIGHARKNAAISAGRKHDVHQQNVCFFPRYPGCTISQSHEMELNGVETVSEEWETATSAAEILDFLKVQLEARGWVDTTEEAFNLSPELRGQGEGRNNLQDPAYLKIYADTMESCLVMQSSSWCMQATLQHGRTASGRIRVVLFAAKTTSFASFAGQLAMAISQPNSPGQKDGIVEVSEASGGNLFHTRVINSRNTPDSAIVEIMGRLADERWMTVFASTKQEGMAAIQHALLKRGEQFAYLTVSPGENGLGSSAVLTEVSEDEDK